ncbi:autophagy-related protein 3 [Diutina catenulata]
MLRSKISSLREYLTPINNSSNFATTGEISPDEFVAAGDYLVEKFPTWQWGTAPKSVQKSFLPADKQYLVTRKVPSYQRATALLGEGTVEEDEEGLISVTAPPRSDHPGDEPSTEIQDLEDIVDDDADFGDIEFISNDEKLRKYDMYITYSTSYRVPKMYLVGFNASGIPLTPSQMFDDINADYKDKTATIEKLPVAHDTTSVSIHPCKHANVMKVLMRHGAGEVRSDHYLVIFLKFIASVTPGIEYDYTMDAL